MEILLDQNLLAFGLKQMLHWKVGAPVFEIWQSMVVGQYKNPCHINLELLAVFYALQAFFSQHKCHVCVKSDNTTTVAYINNMGGMTSEKNGQASL